MNKSALKIVIVLNKRYLGVLTDGDIRRGIFKNTVR